MRQPRARRERIYNCKISRRESAEPAYQIALADRWDAAPPPAVDLRQQFLDWGIGDQGFTGSCVGWAVADSVLRWHFHVNQGLDARERLSVRYVWMAAKEIDPIENVPTTFIEAADTMIRPALEVVKRHGIVRESDLGFNTRRFFRGNVADFYQRANVFRISDYHALPTRLYPAGVQNTCLEWRRWLAFKGPLVACFVPDSTYLTQRYGNGNGRLETYAGPPLPGPLNPGDPTPSVSGHALGVVGYTPTSFILRDSYGLKSGLNGYYEASDSYIQDAFLEAWGVE